MIISDAVDSLFKQTLLSTRGKNDDIFLKKDEIKQEASLADDATPTAEAQQGIKTPTLLTEPRS